MTLNCSAITAGPTEHFQINRGIGAHEPMGQLALLNRALPEKTIKYDSILTNPTQLHTF